MTTFNGAVTLIQGAENARQIGVTGHPDRVVIWFTQEDDASITLTPAAVRVLVAVLGAELARIDERSPK